MASILPDSDTRSASSEVSPPSSPLRHSTAHREKQETSSDEDDYQQYQQYQQYYNQEEEEEDQDHYHDYHHDYHHDYQQEHHLQEHHLQEHHQEDHQHQHHPGSATITAPAPNPIRTSISASHSRSQTLDHVDSSAPTLISPVAVSSLPFRFSGPIKRKPVSSAAAPSSLVTQYLAHGPPVRTTIDLPKPDHRFARSPSVDSPTFYEYPASVKSSARASQTASAPRDDETATASGNNSTHGGGPSPAETADTEFSDVLSEYDDLLSDLAPDATPDNVSVKAHERVVDSQVTDSASDAESVYDDEDDDNNSNHPPSSPMLAPTKHTPPHLRLERVDPSIIEEGPRTYIDDSPQSATIDGSPKLNKPLPRSPGATSPLASIFGWGNPSPSATDLTSLPSSSPFSPNPKNRISTNSLASNYNKTNATTTLAQQRESFFSTHSPHLSQNTTLIDEMEEELKAISSELAASIRREIDLEDLADRLQEQIANNPQAASSKRTSDYFSDSGQSTVKLNEPADQSRDEIEKVQRKAEQEKASLRLELTAKLQEEREKRKELDQKIRQLQERASEVDVVEINNIDASERIQELENTCEDLRRKLSEERQSKTNFEDLLSALKGQLQEACDERDNLRDEVIPELKARVEGLESEAAEYANLTYESSRMQQELSTLKRENSSLRNSMASGIEELPTKRMSVIGMSGLSNLSRSNSMGLSRSNSVATGSLRRGPPGIGGGLKRSDSVKNTATTEPREVLIERLKDVEAQRDALHSALKSLLERQEFQNREYQKKIRALEAERQRLTTVSPRKAGFEKDMGKLRTEINLLRRRAEDAVEQKWQVEKGLGGLKIDLDRAVEEIASLRSVLEANDILIPPAPARLSGSSDTMREPVTSESLRTAYAELQAAYAESLERIRQLEADTADEETQEAMERLERSLSAAVLERDAARREIGQQKAQIDLLVTSESQSIAADATLAQQLKESADLIEQLTAQVRQQLDTNAELRERLEAAVARGESDRKTNSQRISELQERLRVLEDQVVAAQSASEDRIVRHEEEITRLREAHNEQLRRLQTDSTDGSSNRSGPKPLLSTRPLPAKSLEEEADMKTLRVRVLELEKALVDAEDEMQEVVSRMNMAQVEVLNLQEDREAAVRETRRLEELLKKGQAKAGFGGFFSARS
ncbi:hypothetical protein M441DRAFT_143509 [Trichoderma asperellum CBS 433.97]|uniref:DUF7603 domain-containing protein n=2 Tax=Trichoderma asperellum TaxID=101201 RepID=A0A2T3Z476_TRIA4|nr:hypothetical protein M441DRAFT_143509 [Trichoderma asperellum CBS 433.97]PTB39560.1 hypothetical protein M441DRAFT_143509 [Trichoderma asperellum CBS 433.97]